MQVIAATEMSFMEFHIKQLYAKIIKYKDLSTYWKQ